MRALAVNYRLKPRVRYSPEGRPIGYWDRDYGDSQSMYIIFSEALYYLVDSELERGMNELPGLYINKQMTPVVRAQLSHHVNLLLSQAGLRGDIYLDPLALPPGQEFKVLPKEPYFEVYFAVEKVLQNSELTGIGPVPR